MWIQERMQVVARACGEHRGIEEPEGAAAEREVAGRALLVPGTVTLEEPREVLLAQEGRGEEGRQLAVTRRRERGDPDHVHVPLRNHATYEESAPSSQRPSRSR